MDELEPLFEVEEVRVPNKRKRTDVKPAPPPTKKPKKNNNKKADLVKRYLQNFDSSKDIPPDAKEVKSMSIATLENLCTLQEKRSAHQLAPSGLAESVIGFISLVLDGIAGTTEISRLNSEDEELKRCVSEELGCLNTFLGNRLKIASHLTMNSAHAVVKKHATEKQNANNKSEEESTRESIA
jgi:hypothetical protein